jgi:hypothetical protein
MADLRLTSMHASENSSARTVTAVHQLISCAVVHVESEQNSSLQCEKCVTDFGRFVGRLESFVTDQGEGVRWSSRERSPPVLKQVAELFQDGLTVREVAAALKMSKTEAGRLRLRALGEGLLAAGHGGDRLGTNGHNPASWVSANQHSPTQG